MRNQAAVRGPISQPRTRYASRGMTAFATADAVAAVAATTGSVAGVGAEGGGTFI